MGVGEPLLPCVCIFHIRAHWTDFDEMGYWEFTLKVKGKGKVFPVLTLTEHHAMKAYWGSGGTVPPIL